MEIKNAQDVRKVFLRGSVGQLVSGLIWLCSASLGTWVSEKSAILVLVLAIMGKPSALPKGHPFNALAMLVAFIVPINLP